MTERGQISVAACGLLLALVLAGVLVAMLGHIDKAGAAGQRAADQAALAAARSLAADPSASREALSAVARSSAKANGARLRSLRLIETGGLPSGVEVTVEVDGADGDAVHATAAAEVQFSAELPAGSFRPVDLSGLDGRGAVVAAAAAQVGWPYVWGGESRAEGGFDCSGLVDFAYSAAGAPLPGRPTADGLWQLAQHIAASDLLPGDLVFAGATSGTPYHVGLYADQGVVLAAPHTGAVVGYAPIEAGGWDGFGRLIAGGITPPDDREAAAARRHQVPSHVLRAEIEMGLASDPDAAATALASAQSRHSGSLVDALADQLGDASAAALVLSRASGSGLALASRVRLRPVAGLPADDGGAAGEEGRPAGAGAGVAAPTGTRPGGRGVSMLDRVGTVLRAGETVTEQLSERGRAVPLQAAAGIRNLSRFGLSGVGALLPDPDWRDGTNLAGTAWDAASSTRDLVAAAGTAGVEISGVGLWAARFSLLGGTLSTGMFAMQAYTARRTRDRVAYGLMATGSAATTAGLMTGGSLLALGAASSVVPPVGLALIATGATLCVAGYIVRHPEWCRAALSVSGRALDLAWRVQTAPVRVAATAASTMVDGAKSVLDAIPTPW